MVMHVSSGVVRTDTADGTKYLMLEAESGNGVKYFDYVGGTMEPSSDPDEEPVETFLREFHEETGERPEEMIEEITGYEPFESLAAGNLYLIHPHDVRVDERFEPEVKEEHLDYDWMSRGGIVKKNQRGLVSEGRMETLSTIEGVGGTGSDYSFGGDMIDVLVENFDI